MDGLGVRGGLGRLFRRLAHTLSVFLLAKSFVAIAPYLRLLLLQWGVHVSDSVVLGAAKVWQHVGVMFM